MVFNFQTKKAESISPVLLKSSALGFALCFVLRWAVHTDFGKVVTATSCDIDPISRSVLKSLPEARARVKLSRRQASQHVQMWWG